MSQFCIDCGIENQDEAKFCKDCGQQLRTEETEKFEKKKQELDEKEKYSSIGGWLILVGIGIVLSPFRIFAELFIYLQMFKDGTWEAITDSTSEAYDIALALVIIGELVINLLIFIVSAYLVFLFFSKKSLFPKLLIILYIFSLIFIPLDALLVSSIFPEIEMFDSDTIKSFVMVLIPSVIWIPYMLLSVRVKKTFVN